MTTDFSRLDEFAEAVYGAVFDNADRTSDVLKVEDIVSLNPNTFDWLRAHNVNAAVIIVIMLLVAFLNMVSAMLIILLEKTSMIGVLKSLGANNFTIRKVFLWFSVFLIGKGMLWGNIIGLAFYFVQRWSGLFKLDPETYYMATVPVSFNIWLFLLLNAGTLLASVLMLLGPSFLITRIHPATSIRYE